MALWSIKDKPSWLTEEQKKNCIATNRGWVLKNKNGTEELLVAIRGLDVEVQKESVKKEQPEIQEASKNKSKNNKKNIVAKEEEKDVIADPVILEGEGSK